MTTFALPPPGVGGRAFLGAGQMRDALARERGRSNRTGEPFALLVLDLGPADSSAVSEEWLAAHVGRRLRCTDELGRLDQHRVGVLLPHTHTASAAQVLRALLRDTPASAIAAGGRIYGYPRGSPEGAAVEHLDPAGGPDVQPMEGLFVRPLPLWKRLIDIIGAVVGLVVFGPLMLAAMAAIKLVSPGPAIFRQRRSGLGGVPFTMIKLRTMRLGAEAQQVELRARHELEAPVFKLANDPRVIPGGRLLRTTSIDELPQLWNVLRGDMSLVGPRPLPCSESEACLPWQRARLDVTPGMTGLWQVSGRSHITLSTWMRLDLQYVRTRSPLRDVLLLVKTIPAVLFRRGSM